MEAAWPGLPGTLGCSDQTKCQNCNPDRWSRNSDRRSRWAPRFRSGPPGNRCRRNRYHRSGCRRNEQRNRRSRRRIRQSHHKWTHNQTGSHPGNRPHRSKPRLHYIARAQYDALDPSSSIVPEVAHLRSLPDPSHQYENPSSGTRGRSHFLGAGRPWWARRAVQV